jgi:hypothetical protein
VIRLTLVPDRDFVKKGQVFLAMLEWCKCSCYQLLCSFGEAGLLNLYWDSLFDSWLVLCGVKHAGSSTMMSSTSKLQNILFCNHAMDRINLAGPSYRKQSLTSTSKTWYSVRHSYHGV